MSSHIILHHLQKAYWQLHDTHGDSVALNLIGNAYWATKDQLEGTVSTLDDPGTEIGGTNPDPRGRPPRP